MEVQSKRTPRSGPHQMTARTATQKLPKTSTPQIISTDPSPTQPAPITTPIPTPALHSIKKIPPGSKNLPSISTTDLKLLGQKQTKLRRTATSGTALASISPPIRNALSATLIFAQYEAGTAVCVDPAGYILTCAHCFGEDEAEIRGNMPGRRWLLTHSGAAVLTECVAWDVRRDLALLKVIAVEGEDSDVSVCLSSVALSTNTKMARVDVVCIGQPGADDLESADASKKTTYDLFEISEGKLRGLVPAVDPQDNREIGALRHDAWTYWGHSGAPLVREDDGTLVGLHSSWDNQTAMRHAVPLAAIREFLSERLPGVKADIKT